jgi:Putative MetA-pathway of phenol degradation
MVSIRCLAAAASMIWAASTLALQPLVTDDTGTQGAGGNQIEIAFNRDRVHGEGETSTVRSLVGLYTRGVTDSLDAYLAVLGSDIASSMPGEDASGAGNPAIGLKWRFWEDATAKWSAAWKPEVRFGLSARNERRALGTGRTNYASTFIATREVPFGALHANLAVMRVGYELEENRAANRRMLYRLSVAPVFELSPRWKVALDAGLTTNPDKARRARMGYVELGAIWQPHEDLEFALGWIEQSGDGDPRTRTLTAGVTWRFR